MEETQGHGQPIHFDSLYGSEWVAAFRPNLTPRQLFALGSFGGTYWRPIYSQVTGKHHENRHLRFTKVVEEERMVNWWAGIPANYLTTPWSSYAVEVNRYKVKAGLTLEAWEEHGWIHPQDPYGWVEWYCHFYMGRRTEDDTRQIKRWLAYCGPRGRFKRNLINKIKAKGSTYDDPDISPVIRQGLQHWAYQITAADLQE